MVDKNIIPVKKDGIDERELGDEVIIIAEDGKEMHTLSDTGKFIWENINGENSIEKLIKKICLEYDVPISQADSDVIVFIKNLFDKKLIIKN